jgi:hypothetical protein
VLILEDKQIAALDQAATESFEGRMTAHLVEYFPEE